MDIGTLLTLGGIGLGASALSGSLNFASSAASSKRSFEYQKRLLNMQQSWAERMANTAHQREVADLRSAGLNPILSATGGSGASTPVVSASSVSGQNGNFDLASGFIDGINTGIGVAKMDSAIKSVDAQTALSEAKVKTEASQQKLNDSLAAEAAAKTEEINSGLPLNRIPGTALKTSPSIFREVWNAGKEFFNSSGSAKRLEQMEADARNHGIYRKSDGSLERTEDYSFNVKPAGEVVNGEFKPYRGFEYMTK